MRLRFLFVFALLLFGTAAHAQIPVYIQAGTTNPNTFQAETTAAVKAKIGSSSRYYISDVTAAVITVHILCLEAAPVRGGACAYKFVYYPRPSSGLSTELDGGGLITKSEPQRAAETIFEDFVDATGSQKLIDAAVFLESCVSTYQAKYAPTESKKSPN